jgi:hypothetical protein
MQRYHILAGAAALLLASPAHAITIDTVCGPGTEGGACEPTGESKIFLQAAKDVTVGFGNVGSQNGLPVVKFVSDGGSLNLFIDLSNGFGTITPAKTSSGKQVDFNGIDISVPGYTFTDIVFDEQLTPVKGQTSDPFTITAHDTLGTQTNTVFDAADTDKLFSVVANIGAFTDVNIQAPGGFDEIKHLEISGLSPVPIPGALPLFFSGLAGLVFLAKKKRQIANNLV